MLLPADSTVYLRIWTGQTCRSCGAEFRYLRRFAVPRAQTTQNATAASVEAEYVKAAAETAEVFPCPHCGYVQPDMEGGRKAVRHGVFTFAAFFAPLLLTIAAGFTLLPPLPAVLANAGIALAALLYHLAVAAGNPNRDRTANLTKAQLAVQKGLLRLDKEGGPASAPAVPKPAGACAVAALLMVLSAGAFLLPMAVAIPVFFGNVAGIVLFIWSGSAFANAALTLRDFAGPKQVVEASATVGTDEEPPEDFKKAKKK
jgi:hypothetical protein